MPKGLSKAERDDVKARVSAQADYLRGFVQAAPDLSDAQVAQRAVFYLGAVRATYYGARFPGLPSYPGDGQTACKTNCKCHLKRAMTVCGGSWTAQKLRRLPGASGRGVRMEQCRDGRRARDEHPITKRTRAAA